MNRDMRRSAPCALALVLLAAMPASAQQQREHVTSDPALPFSQAVRVGGTIYLSGMLGTDANGLVAGGIQPETRRTLENIRRTLTSMGADMDDIVKCTVFLADMSEWAAMNEVYVTFFPGSRPARSAVAVSGLALGARVEIECVAVTDG